jgi:hypothetical protein
VIRADRRRAAAVAATVALFTARAAPARPVYDEPAGRWVDTFDPRDTLPGESLAVAEEVEVAGTGDDGTLTLRLHAPRTATVAFAQDDWSDGPGALAVRAATPDAGFHRASANVLYRSLPVPGALVLAPTVVEQEGLPDAPRHAVTPLRAALPVGSFFAGGGAAGFPARPQHSVLFLYMEATSGDLYLGVAHNDERARGPGGDVGLDFDVSPASAAGVAVADDAGELQPTASGRLRGRWSWAAGERDGGAIGPLPATFSAVVVVAAQGDGWRDAYRLLFESYADANLLPSLPLGTAPQTAIRVSGDLAGSVESHVFDAGALDDRTTRRWDHVSVDRPEGAAGGASLRVRGASSQDALAARPWSDPLDGGADVSDLLAPDARFVQYRLELAVPDPASAPDVAPSLAVVDAVALTAVTKTTAHRSVRGLACSVVIAPVERPLRWGTLVLDARLPSGASVEAGAWDPGDDPTRAPPIAAGADLSAIDPAVHPSLRVCARLAGASPEPDAAPAIHAWSVSWVVDVDHDGVPDARDNCPDVANGSQVDRDDDRAGDACDRCPEDPRNDPDGDGACTADDNCPLDANGAQDDADGDGRGDACDRCPSDAADDADGDRHCADADNCPAVANRAQADADGDGRGDTCDGCPRDADDDVDRDGLCADADNCPLTYNRSQQDADGDGRGNACDDCPGDVDDDADGDGVCGDVDVCPDAADAAQSDADRDGVGDTCDNCPTRRNADQSDRNGDGHGDACDGASGGGCRGNTGAGERADAGTMACALAVVWVLGRWRRARVARGGPAAATAIT